MRIPTDTQHWEGCSLCVLVIRKGLPGCLRESQNAELMGTVLITCLVRKRLTDRGRLGLAKTLDLSFQIFHKRPESPQLLQSREGKHSEALLGSS